MLEIVKTPWSEKALKKLKEGKVTGRKEIAMAGAVRAQLENFCIQDAEFAQAVAEGGSFPDCMKAVAAKTGESISDLEAYQKAVQFYFPGALIRMQIYIDLVGDAAGEDQPELPILAPVPAPVQEPREIILDLDNWLL